MGGGPRMGSLPLWSRGPNFLSWSKTSYSHFTGVLARQGAKDGEAAPRGLSQGSQRGEREDAVDDGD